MLAGINRVLPAVLGDSLVGATEIDWVVVGACPPNLRRAGATETGGAVRAGEPIGAVAGLALLAGS